VRRAISSGVSINDVPLSSTRSAVGDDGFVDARPDCELGVFVRLDALEAPVIFVVSRTCSKRWEL